MKYVFSYLKDYKKESVLAPLFKLLEALFDLFVPLVVARIIDYGIKERNQAYVFQQVGLLALFGPFRDHGQHYCPVVCRQGQRGPGQPAAAGGF